MLPILIVKEWGQPNAHPRRPWCSFRAEGTSVFSKGPGSIKHIASAGVSFAGFVYVLGRLRAQPPSSHLDYLRVLWHRRLSRGPARAWASPSNRTEGLLRFSDAGSQQCVSTGVSTDSSWRRWSVLLVAPPKRLGTRSWTTHRAPSREPSILFLRLRARGGAGRASGHDRPERLPDRQNDTLLAVFADRRVLGCGRRVGLVTPTIIESERDNPGDPWALRQVHESLHPHGPSRHLPIASLHPVEDKPSGCAVILYRAGALYPASERQPSWTSFASG